MREIDRIITGLKMIAWIDTLLMYKPKTEGSPAISGRWRGLRATQQSKKKKKSSCIM